MIDLFPIWDKLLKKKLDNDTNRKKSLVKYQTRELKSVIFKCRPWTSWSDEWPAFKVTEKKSLDKIRFLYNQTVKNGHQLFFKVHPYNTKIFFCLLY